MKTIIYLLLLACLPLRAQAEDSAKLEVHEWGTITVLSGSDGVPLNWYQGPGYADEVPSFVQMSPFGTKGLFTAPAAPVRMETPVIYFYPDKPLRVNVTASFIGGRITEWFPAAKPDVPDMGKLIFAEPASMAPAPSRPVTWEGDLLPPVDEAARNQIPAVPAGKGEHYRHAREVPNAWIFRSTTPTLRGDADPAKGKDADKFIFYRGIGQNPPPYGARVGDDGTVSLRRLGGQGAITHAFALTVTNGAARWSRMPELAAPTNDATTPPAESLSRSDTPTMTIEKAAEELAAAMRESLTAAGLTPDEARAMVATWDGHWFREPGTRVLAILPRDWVDSVLPLTIHPTPTKLTRVFVARFEMLSPQRESALLTLLNESASGPEQAARLKDLELARFAQGALARAHTLHTRRMSQQFQMLQREVLKAARSEQSTSATR